MDEKREQARKEIKRSLPALAVGVVFGLLTTVYELYKLVAVGADLGQFLGTLCSLVAGVFLVFTVLALRNESKTALPMFLSGLTLGLFRWIVIDRSFQLNIAAFILLGIFAWLTWRIISWIRATALF